MITSLHFHIGSHIRVLRGLLYAGAKSQGEARSNSAFLDLPIRHVIFTHSSFGRCLIDTGYTRAGLQGPASLGLRLYRAFARVRFTSAALDNHSGVGADKAFDHVLVSHFHVDHVSGLRDLDQSQIWADAQAYERARTASWWSNMRHGLFAELLPSRPVTDWRTLPTRPSPLGAGFDLFGDGSCLAISLPGHGLPHYGFLFHQSYLYAVDAHYSLAHILGTAQANAASRLAHANRKLFETTNQKLRAFLDQGGQIALCHDPDGPEGEVIL